MGSLSNSRATTPVSEYDAAKVVTYNEALQVLDNLAAGLLDVSITSADVTLTGTPAAPQAQRKYFNVTGTLTGNRSLVFPVNDDDPAVGNPRVIVVKNATAGAFTLTVKVSGQTGVTVTQGTTAILLHNGTDFVKIVEGSSSGGDLITPLVTGGTGTASSLTLKSTSGVGATDFIKFLVGNNGATEALRILTSGFVGVGTVTPKGRLQVDNRTMLGQLNTAAPTLSQLTGNIYYSSGYKHVANGTGTIFQFGDTDFAFYTAVSGSADAAASPVERFRVGVAGAISMNGTITAAGTTGAQTINKPSGSVNFAAAATSLVVTNSLVTASSVIIATVATNDATMKSVACVAAAGSFTMHANAAATAETRVNFLVLTVS